MKVFDKKQENSDLFLMVIHLSSLPVQGNHFKSENIGLRKIILISNNNLYQSAKLLLKFFTIFTY